MWGESEGRVVVGWRREEGGGMEVEEDIKSYISTWQDIVVFWCLGTKLIGNVYIRVAIVSTGFYTKF